MEMERVMGGWDKNLYVDEAALDYRLDSRIRKKLGKHEKLHMLAVGVGVHLETEDNYEKTDTYRVLDWTGLCFFNDLNNHGMNSSRRNETGRLTGYWKMLATYSNGLILSVIDRFDDKLKKELKRTWTCMQTFKYMTVADRFDDVAIRPVIAYGDEHQNVDNGNELIESNYQKIELSPEELKEVPEASIKKQKIGKMMRKILAENVVLDFNTIDSVVSGDVLEMTHLHKIDTVPFWDLTMTDQQLEKYVYGAADLYSKEPNRFME